MASRNSYSHQKELLVKLQEALEVFRQDMSNVARNYKSTVQNLHEEEGMMDETYEEYYINYLNPTVEVYVGNCKTGEVWDVESQRCVADGTVEGGGGGEANQGSGGTDQGTGGEVGQ